MQLSAVTLARLFAFIEPADLNPRGRTHYPDLAAALVGRYGFLKYPQKSEDFDESKGISFNGGKFGEIGNINVQIWSYGILVDTSSSTDDSEKVLEDALSWGAKAMGLAYKPGLIKRKAFVSQLTFHSDINLESLHPALSNLSKRLTGRVPLHFGQSVVYMPTAFSVGYDPTSIKAGPSAFTIERRNEIPFSENKYFSTAPLTTSEHLTFLNEFETDVLSSQ
jgi:hypothetical protein